MRNVRAISLFAAGIMLLVLAAVEHATLDTDGGTQTGKILSLLRSRKPTELAQNQDQQPNGTQLQSSEQQEQQQDQQQNQGNGGG